MEESFPPGGAYIFEDDTETVLALAPSSRPEELIGLIEKIERRAADQVYQIPALATRTVPEPLSGLCDAYEELCAELADGGTARPSSCSPEITSISTTGIPIFASRTRRSSSR